MTSDEILDLRLEDLNYIIALEVFKYQPDTHRPGSFLRGDTSFCPRDYSRDVHAAFDVVKEMRKKGWGFALTNTGEQWKATFHVDEKNNISVVDVTAEIAICKAALLARSES